MRPFRTAARLKNPTVALLRTVRQTLNMTTEEVGAAMGVCKSAVSRLEYSEERGTIMMRALARAANAMGCDVVYGIVPKDGRTLEEVVERKMWRKLLEAEKDVNLERTRGAKEA
ncbi:MAG: hypothetical protein KGN79_03915 [Acidobacteriota bacterium]|nr:hypothetical protein [Acidobacteriota bacterium]